MQQAYDFAAFEGGKKAGQGSAQLRAVAGGKKKQTRLRRMAMGFWNILGCALMLALAVLLIQSKVTITELNTQVRRTQDSLTTAQSTYNYMNSELNARTSMANIEDVANRLGLMKVDDSQVTYVRLEESSVLTAAQSPVKRWTAWLQSGILSMMETLDP